MDTNKLNLRQPAGLHLMQQRVRHELSDRLICILFWAYRTHFQQIPSLNIGTSIPGREATDFYQVMYEFMPFRHGWQASKFCENVEKLKNRQASSSCCSDVAAKSQPMC